MPFRNSPAPTNNAQEVLLFKVRAETLCVGETFEAVLAPREVAYFSSSTSGFCVLTPLKANPSLVSIEAVQKWDGKALRH